MEYLVFILITVVLMGSTDGQYPECIGCSAGAGLIPLSPLSYNTVRSNVFNGTQPSNEGCTNGVIVNGQVTINCGQGTTLTDCNRRLSTYYPDYSDLSNTFAWNRTTSVAGRVSIVFRFYQQINISRISLFFWNSQSDSIIVPNVTIYQSNDESIPSGVINFTPSNSPNRNYESRRRLNFDVSNPGVLQFQYLRIEMTFFDQSEWIFLGEVFFCGNTAPHHITHPSTDNDVQIVSPTATMASVTCSLNVTILSFAIWTHNGSATTDRSQATTTGNTTTLVIRNLQPSDAGDYQCEFNDVVGSGWVLRRNIRLFITDPQIIQPPDNFNIITFDESTSSVQLMCSLNVPIPSSVTIVWTHNRNHVRPPNEVTTTGSTTTLVIRNLQPSDAGEYQCTFSGLYLGKTFQLVFTNTLTTSAADIATITTTVVTIDHNLSATSSVVPVVTDTNSIASTYATMTVTTVTTASSSNLPTSLSSFDSNNNNNNSSSSVGIIVAIVVLVVVVIIIITVVVVGIIVVWKRKKNQQHNKPAEDVYYSTIDARTLQTSPPSKPEAVYSELNDKQDSKEPQYMDVTGGVHSTKQADKVIVQDNPAYSVHQTKDNPANDYSIPNDQQVKMQDNPAYSVANM